MRERENKVIEIEKETQNETKRTELNEKNKENTLNKICARWFSTRVVCNITATYMYVCEKRKASHKQNILHETPNDKKEKRNIKKMNKRELEQ